MTLSRPFVSSPLASSSDAARTAVQRPAAQRTPSFPSSRPLRPFPSISHAVRQPTSSGPTSKKPVKIIQPPENHKVTFMLNLTQAEFSRQE
ncbi:hypothetical protein AX16_005597 [Volvariella volvacea WC 439]|nr:hypothetical protein AX16_005597 [Volvariella volvacea WC 439]